MANNKNICVIANIGSHYRLPIYRKMAKELSCDFYFGDKIETSLKTFDYQSLPGYQRTLKNIFFHHFYWQHKSVFLITKPYKYYILDGEPYCLSSWAILFLAKLMGKKTIAWSHGWYGKESKIKRIIKKWFYSLHYKLMIYGEYAINLMRKEGLPSEKMFCIANSMDSDKEKYLRSIIKQTSIFEDYFHNSFPTVIYCGRIQKGKKLEMLIDCINILQKEGINFNVIMVGNDVEDVKINCYAKKRNVEDRVWLYGPCYDDLKIGELFYNAHVCVSPGNVGLTAIHSLSFGCPVITHNDFPYQMPEFEAIIPNVTGDFYQRGNINDLSQKIKKWISLNPNKREVVRLAAYKEIDRKWNINYQIEIIKKVLE